MEWKRHPTRNQDASLYGKASARIDTLAMLMRVSWLAFLRISFETLEMLTARSRASMARLANTKRRKRKRMSNAPPVLAEPLANHFHGGVFD